MLVSNFFNCSQRYKVQVDKMRQRWKIEDISNQKLLNRLPDQNLHRTFLGLLGISSLFSVLVSFRFFLVHERLIVMKTVDNSTLLLLPFIFPYSVLHRYMIRLLLFSAFLQFLFFFFLVIRHSQSLSIHNPIPSFFSTFIYSGHFISCRELSKKK
jgi:hypothetical protein